MVLFGHNEAKNCVNPTCLVIHCESRQSWNWQTMTFGETETTTSISEETHVVFVFCYCYFEILVFDGKAWRNVWTSFACVTRPSQISGRTWAAKAAWISYVQVCMYTYCSDTFVMKVWSLSNFVFPSSSLGISGETGSCYRLTPIMARRTLCKTLLKKWMLYHQLLFT